MNFKALFWLFLSLFQYGHFKGRVFTGKMIQFRKCSHKTCLSLHSHCLFILNSLACIHIPNMWFCQHRHTFYSVKITKFLWLRNYFKGACEECSTESLKTLTCKYNLAIRATMSLEVFVLTMSFKIIWHTVLQWYKNDCNDNVDFFPKLYRSKFGMPKL
jgi:hypothetical protein